MRESYCHRRVENHRVRQVLPVRHHDSLPFDVNLFDTSMMTDEEIEWVNSYHDMVRSRLTPLLSGEEAKWLEEKTRHISK